MVTVIIPTYKRASFIDRAIQSVLKQTYKEIEVIVVDDNNPNTIERKNMEEKMKKYENDNRIIYLKHEKNRNGASARNTGIKRAHGDYITFLDDDDFFLRKRIENLVNILEKNTEYDCAYTNVIKINKDKIRNLVFARKNGNQQYEMLIQNSFLGTGSNMFFRKKAIDDLKKFDEDFLRYQDLEFMVRFFRKHKIISVDEFTVVKDDESRINSANEKNLYNMLNLFLEKFESDISKYENAKEIYYINYNRLYNTITNKKIKADIKKKLEQLHLKPKIDIKKMILKKSNLLRETMSILRGTNMSKKISQSERKEMFNIIKEGQKNEINQFII